MVRNSCSTIREKAIIETLFSTGCRVSELINIKLSDMDLSKMEITVLGKGQKYRKVYLNVKARMLIKKYLEGRKVQSEYLFSPDRNNGKDKLTKSGLEAIIKKLGIKAKLKRPLYPHLIRHTIATLALQRGMDATEIQKMLGHENIETTMIYAKVSNEDVKLNHKKFVV